ncbi:MAG: lysophospholipid acyltransferase family protein [Deltaproteobacteria bacterium]|jgi:lysophospholipid acyltransferase (LPLAT)-like uncharacterized protein|nr:lysophospholipid acyltransferase family protein [Deltaproteobacteria bacterium]
MKISPSLIVPPLHCLYRAWAAGLRLEMHGREQVDKLYDGGTRLVFCVWHDEIFSLVYLSRNLRLAAVVSRSNDGEYLARVMDRLGFYPVRGSSSRGGVAALLKAAQVMRKENLSSVLTMDGPRGPRHVLKDGVFLLAQRANALLVPVRAFNRNAIRFGSWDRFQLPLPFSRTKVVFGEPYPYTSPGISEASLIVEREKLYSRMQELEDLHSFK